MPIQPNTFGFVGESAKNNDYSWTWHEETMLVPPATRKVLRVHRDEEDSNKKLVFTQRAISRNAGR